MKVKNLVCFFSLLVSMSVSSVIDVEAVDLSDSEWEHESSDEENDNCGNFREIGRLHTKSTQLKRRFYELKEDYNKGMKLPFDRNKLYGEMSEIVRILSDIVNEVNELEPHSTEGARLPGAFKMLFNEIIANNREIKEEFEYIDNYQTLSSWYSPKNYNEVFQRTKSIKGDFFKCLGDYRAAEDDGDQVAQETLEKKLLNLQAEFFCYMGNFEDRIKKEVVYVPERFLDLLESMQKDYDEIQSSLPFRQTGGNWYTKNNYDEVFNRAKDIKEEFDNCLTQYAVLEDKEEQEALKRTSEFLKEQFHEHMNAFENKLNSETGEVPKQFLDLLESMQKDYDEIQSSLPFRQTGGNWYTKNNYDEVFNRAKDIKEEFDNCLTQYAVLEDKEEQEALKRTSEFLKEQFHEHMNAFENKLNSETGEVPKQFLDLLESMQKDYDEIQSSLPFRQTGGNWYTKNNYDEVFNRAKDIKEEFDNCLTQYAVLEDKEEQEALKRTSEFLKEQFHEYMNVFENKLNSETGEVPKQFLDLLESMQKDYDEIQSSLPFRQTGGNWYTKNNYDEVFNRAKDIKEEFDNCLTQYAVLEDKEEQEALKRTSEFLKEQFHEHMNAFENKLNSETGEVPKQFLDLLESMQKDYDEIQSSFLRVINKNEKPASNQNEKLVINQNETPTINQIKTPVSIPTRDLVTGGESVVGLEMDSLPLGELIETDRLPQTNESNSQFFVYTGTCCIIFCGCIWIRKRL